jgi:hypothetical protein
VVNPSRISIVKPNLASAAAQRNTGASYLIHAVAAYMRDRCGLMQSVRTNGRAAVHLQAGFRASAQPIRVRQLTDHREEIRAEAPAPGGICAAGARRRTDFGEALAVTGRVEREDPRLCHGPDAQRAGFLHAYPGDDRNLNQLRQQR